jgi:heptaprenyl diphosphate synthase
VSRTILPGLEAPDATLEVEVRGRLGDVEAALTKAVQHEPGILADSAEYLLNAGGKRFRPMLVLLTGYYGDPSDERLIPGSVAIELVHLATLYHDDVIDEADARRGTPSANARWDNTVAILTGDFLFARASEIIADVGTDPTRLLAKAIATVCDGQIREVSVSGSVDQSVDHYLGTIRRKTSALLAASCRLGALLSGTPDEYHGILEEIGDEIGTAFQLSDDIMDLTVSAEVLGKEPGVDLKEGVYTLPVLHALSDGSSAEELHALLAPGPPTGADFERALEIVRSNGSLDHARAAVAGSVDRAIELVGLLPRGPASDALVQLSEFLATRCGAR